MYAHHEDDHEGEEWKATPKKKYKKKKLRTNPDGPYNVKFVFKNVNWDITIENESEDDNQHKEDSESDDDDTDDD